MGEREREGSCRVGNVGDGSDGGDGGAENPEPRIIKEHGERSLSTTTKLFSTLALSSETVKASDRLFVIGSLSPSLPFSPLSIKRPNINQINQIRRTEGNGSVLEKIEEPTGRGDDHVGASLERRQLLALVRPACQARHAEHVAVSPNLLRDGRQLLPELSGGDQDEREGPVGTRRHVDPVIRKAAGDRQKER